MRVSISRVKVVFLSLTHDLVRVSRRQCKSEIHHILGHLFVHSLIAQLVDGQLLVLVQVGHNQWRLYVAQQSLNRLAEAAVDGFLLLGELLKLHLVRSLGREVLFLETFQDTAALSVSLRPI